VLDDASEEEAEDLFPDSTDKAAAATRENRKEREEKLKKMMDDDDDEEADGMPGFPTCILKDDLTDMDADEEMPDADEEPREPTPVEQLPPSKPAELKEEVTVQGGRRRGKRQVMKKKTVKDEEGYLGPCIQLRPACLATYTNVTQLLGKRRRGSLSPRMSRCPRRSLRLMFPRRRLAKLQGRVISCLSLGRSDVVLLRCHNQFLKSSDISNIKASHVKYIDPKGKSRDVDLLRILCAEKSVIVP
jgi:hypothetical protein